MHKMLIALSGIDGAGKSTQLELIKSHYENRGVEVISLWTRGGNTPGMNFVKNFLRRLAGKKLPASGRSIRRDKILSKPWIQRLWLTLAIFDLIKIYGISIRWLLFKNNLVICDRYIWDTLIDFKIMFPDIHIERWILWRFLVFITPVPARSVLLMIPIEVSKERCLKKYEPFPDTDERRTRRYELYKNASTFKYWEAIDSTQPEETVFSNIVKSKVT